MKFNFSQVELTDINGKPMQEANVHKLLALMMYRHAKNLDLVELARKINAGEEVEIEKVELEEITGLINMPSEAGGFHAFSRKALLEYINKVKTESMGSKTLPTEK